MIQKRIKCGEIEEGEHERREGGTKPTTTNNIKNV